LAPALDHRPLALLIDRDPDTRQMYAEFLHGAAYEIDQAEDGREGLAKALTRHPDVIVTEMRLTGISGLDLCRVLRDDAVTHDIPIVVVTADAFETDVKRARAAGADVVLTKPCLPDHLASAIQRLLHPSQELGARANTVFGKLGEPLARSEEVLEQVRSTRRHVMLCRTLNRRETTTPPQAVPSVVCPVCDQPLRYTKSHIGGVSERHQEQWDYYECAVGCGTFQYRQRTRKLRRVT
jgi:CheY-like chemotaxis protein